ncbi:MAG TPA: FtsX-like permease family protein [Acidimicrobiia bacterium]|nr:FtsX-like permease family protein [Acidimicrobiia bacterium]
MNRAHERARAPMLRTKLRRDMAASRWQFVAVAVTIFLGIMLYGATADAYNNLVASYHETYQDLKFADFWSTGGDATTFATEARALDGVAAVDTRTVVNPPIRVGPDRFEGRVIGMPPEKQPSVNDVLIQHGRYLDSSDPDGVLVEQHMADTFSLSVGDSVSVLGPSDWVDLSVVGIAASAEYIWPARSNQDVLTPADSFGVLFASEALAGELASGDATTQVGVRYTDGGADNPSLDAELASLAQETESTDSYTRADQPSNAALQQDVSGFNELSYLFPILFLTAAGLATYVLLTRLVQRQRPTIGMLRANGFGRRTIFGHYVRFGILAGLGGAIPGVVAGAVLGLFISRMYTSFISVPLTVTTVHPATILIGLLFGLVAGFLCAAAPALAASRETPAAAMRDLIPSATGRRTLLERLVPPVRRLPTRWRLVFRNLSRNRRRTIYTLLGVVMALSLVLVSWGMLDTVDRVLTDQERIERADAVAIPTAPTASAILDPIRDTDGVSTAEPVISASVSVRGRDASFATTFTGYETDTQMHVFEVDGHGAEPLPSTGIYLGSAIGKELDVSVGDTVTLAFSTGQNGHQAGQETEVAGFVTEPLGNFVYSSLDTAKSLTGLSAPNQVSALFDSGADANSALRTIEALPGVAAAVNPQDIVTTMRDFMSLFYGFVGIMLVFGAVMAFAMIFATMSVNVAERRAEIASLRAEGFSLRTIRRMLSVENVTMVILGIIPGLIVGVALGWGFIKTFQSDQFSFQYAISPLALIASAVAIIIVALVSEVPALRALRRIDIPAVLRDRSA